MTTNRTWARSTFWGGRDAPSKICSYYGCTGHTIDVFYGKHGYPPGHPCYLGRPRFHNRGIGIASINNSVVNDSKHVPEGEAVHKDAPLGPGLQLTPTQRQSLLAFLQPAGCSSPVVSSKANNHVISQVRLPTPVPGDPSLGNIFIYYSYNTAHKLTCPHHHSNAQSSPWIIDSETTTISPPLYIIFPHTIKSNLSISLMVLWSRHIILALFNFPHPLFFMMFFMFLIFSLISSLFPKLFLLFPVVSLFLVIVAKYRIRTP